MKRFIILICFILTLFFHIDVVNAAECTTNKDQTSCVVNTDCHWKTVPPGTAGATSTCIDRCTFDYPDQSSSSRDGCRGDTTCQWTELGMGNGQCTNKPTGCAAKTNETSCVADTTCVWNVTNVNRGGNCTDKPAGCAANETKPSCEADPLCEWTATGPNIGVCGDHSAPQGSFSSEIPGITCGMAEGEDGINKCCNTTPQSLPGLPFGSLLKLIPGIGSFVGMADEQNAQLKALQKKTLTACIYGQPSNTGGAGCTCKLSAASKGEIKEISEMCAKYLQGSEQTICTNCSKGGGIYTGIGCIPLDLGNFISSFILSIGIALATIAAFGCIIYSAFVLQTSQGNPERIKKARQYLTSCITGLIIIIFSVFILRLIGVTILNIPFLR